MLSDRQPPVVEATRHLCSAVENERFAPGACATSPSLNQPSWWRSLQASRCTQPEGTRCEEHDTSRAWPVTSDLTAHPRGRPLGAHRPGPAEQDCCRRDQLWGPIAGAAWCADGRRRPGSDRPSSHWDTGCPAEEELRARYIGTPPPPRLAWQAGEDNLPSPPSRSCCRLASLWVWRPSHRAGAATLATPSSGLLQAAPAPPTHPGTACGWCRVTPCEGAAQRLLPARAPRRGPSGEGGASAVGALCCGSMRRELPRPGGRTRPPRRDSRWTGGRSHSPAVVRIPYPVGDLLSC